MSSLAEIPTTGDATQWTDSQKALMEFAGLYKKINTSNGEQMVLAPRAIVEAFAQTVQRTQLDPIARQIYCIERGGKYSISVGIDGARLVAQRSGEYAGQRPIEWTADGEKWVDVWLSKEPPAAARAGVMRKGFSEPLYAVATWDSYAPYWNGKLGQVWSQHGPLMLGKCAEMLALRKAFPMELSGLYVAEEMDTAQAAQSVISSKDWLAELKLVDDKADLRKLFKACKDSGEMTPAISAEFMAHATNLTKDSDVIEVVESEVVDEIIPAEISQKLDELLEEAESKSGKAK
jgi:phage recombination protein Bet